MFFLTPTPRSSSLRRDGYVTTAESATWAAGGVDRLATAWVCMHGRKDGSVSVGWDGRIQPTGATGAYRATKQRATFAIEKKNK